MKFFALTILLSVSVFAEKKRDPNSIQIPPTTLERLKRLYPEQSEDFIVERFKNANSALMKWRSFPPYYYQMVDRLQKELVKYKSLTAAKGLCAGDAHLENFGYLYLPDTNQSKFGLNDLDDVSECTLILDTLRLLVGHKLVDPSIDTSAWHSAYMDGLSGKSRSAPADLSELLADSLKKKNGTSKKYRKMFESKTCSGEFAAMNANEKATLDYYLLNANLKYSFACMRAKDSGGSAGRSRFVVEANEFKKDKLVFELKPLSNPSPLYNKIPTSAQRLAYLQTAIEKFWSPEYKAYYYPVTLNGLNYLRRPVWGGNTGVAADELSDWKY